MIAGATPSPVGQTAARSPRETTGAPVEAMRNGRQAKRLWNADDRVRRTPALGDLHRASHDQHALAACPVGVEAARRPQTTHLGVVHASAEGRQHCRAVGASVAPACPPPLSGRWPFTSARAPVTPPRHGDVIRSGRSGSQRKLPPAGSSPSITRLSLGGPVIQACVRHAVGHSTDKSTLVRACSANASDERLTGSGPRSCELRLHARQPLNGVVRWHLADRQALLALVQRIAAARHAIRPGK
jgi:hypothetical protein